MGMTVGEMINGFETLATRMSWTEVTLSYLGCGCAD